MSHTKKIVIFGTGGTCLDILDTIHDLNDAAGEEPLSCVGFLDDTKEHWGTTIAGVLVLGPLATAAKLQDCYFVNGIGSPRNFWRKESIIAGARVGPDRFVTLVHPSATLSRTARVGRGCVLFQHVAVTTNVTLGAHVTVLPNTVLNHDTKVGDCSIIAGGVCVSGQVTIGRSCYLGSNCTIRDGVNIGEYSLVGMGSVVVADVKPSSLVFGVPARFVRSISPQ